MTSQQIPKPLLDVLSTYCKNDTDNINLLVRVIVDASPSLKHAGFEYCYAIAALLSSDVHPELILRFIKMNEEWNSSISSQSHAAPNPVLVMNNPPTQPVSASPHSPTKVKGPKPHYWIKVVTSYNPNQPNGYGVKGKFVTPQQIPNLAYGTVLVTQTRDVRTRDTEIRIFTVDHNTVPNYPDLTFPNACKAAITMPHTKKGSQYSSYAQLFAALKLHNIPEVT